MRLELRWTLDETHTKQFVRSVVMIAENPGESAMLDQAFGSKVGEDGVIDKASREVVCKLADGYGEHYVNIAMRGPVDRKAP